MVSDFILNSNIHSGDKARWREIYGKFLLDRTGRLGLITAHISLATTSLNGHQKTTKNSKKYSVQILCQELGKNNLKTNILSQKWWVPYSMP